MRFPHAHITFSALVNVRSSTISNNIPVSFRISQITLHKQSRSFRHNYQLSSTIYSHIVFPISFSHHLTSTNALTPSRLFIDEL